MKKRYNVILEVEVDAPDNATEKDIEEFIRFEFHANGDMSCGNPCYEYGDYDVKDCDIYPA